MCTALVEYKGLSFAVVNQYFQFKDDPSIHSEKMDKILQTLKGKNIIWMADANAKSELWHSETDDEAGAMVEEILEKHQLRVINAEGQPKTFCDSRGRETNIDITAMTGTMEKKVCKWVVRPDATQSDHRLIEIQIQIQNPNKEKPGLPSYNLRRADWEAVKNTLRETAKGTTSCRRTHPMSRQRT